jgi:uncharacterized protein (TIRG00374 family)
MSRSSTQNQSAHGAVQGEEESEVQPTHKRSPGGGMRKRIFFWCKFLASFALIGFVVWKTGLTTESGRARFLLMLQGINPVYLFLSLLCGVVLTIISSWRWRILLHSKGIDISLFRLISFYFIGRFFNLFLPTSMGGDVVRIVSVATHSGEKEEALASVFVERLVGMITLLAVSICALFFGLRNYDLPVITASLFFVAGLSVLILWLVFDKRLLARISVFLGNRFHPALGVLGKITRVQGVIRDYKDNPLVMVKVFGVSCLFYFMAIVNVWVSARAFVPDVAFSSMLLAVPAIMLVMNLPVSIGGLGLMEASYTLIFPLFGYTPALALSVALLMRFKTLVYGGVGAILHLNLLRSRDKENV